MLKELEGIASKLQEAHTVLYRTLNNTTDEQATQIMVTPEWSVKDVASHLAGAERGMLRLAQRFAKGEDPQLPSDYNNDEYNARQVAKRKSMPLSEIRAELDTIQSDMATFLDGITAQQLALCGQHPLEGEVSLKDLLIIIYTHSTTHCKEITNAIHESKK